MPLSIIFRWYCGRGAGVPTEKLKKPVALISIEYIVIWVEIYIPTLVVIEDVHGTTMWISRPR